MPRFTTIQEVLQRDYASGEFKNRIQELIKYAALPVVEFEWTRPAHDDLTSMGTPFVEPATKVVGYREMNPTELAAAIQEVILSFPLVPGEVHDMLYPKEALQDRLHTYCNAPRRSVKESRCLRCRGCINYIEVIDTIRGKFLEKSNVPEKMGVLSPQA